MPLKELRGIFPNLSDNPDKLTSPIDIDYNCVSWALDISDCWIEPYGLIIPSPSPPYYWPENIPQDNRTETYVKLFEHYGFEVTDDPSIEDNNEKIVIYSRDNEFQHVARQLPNGDWTSKIGKQEDIRHSLNELEASGPYSYGSANIFMKKQK